VSEPSPASPDPSSIPTLGSAERVLLGAIAGAPPIDPRRLGLFAGDRLGRYEIVRELGRGGMGAVFLARDALLDRDVALKVLDPSAGSGSDVAARVVREARASSRLVHPSIARIYDVGDDAGLVFLAMEHVPGATLRARLRDPAPVSPRDAAAIGVAIARALATAHRAGIVHRDLKPENVILGEGGRVCVVDFGLAQSVPEIDARAREGRARGAAGTPGYVAPELAAGGRPDARSDLFSLGVIVGELAARRDERTPAHVALDRIAARLVDPDPERRFASAEYVAVALERAGTRSFPRLRTTSAVLAGVVVAGTVAASVAMLRGDARDAPHTPPDDLDRVALALGAPTLSVAPPAIACPPFAASGVAPPRVWLGAAAANLACRRLAMTLGDPQIPLATPARLAQAQAAPVETDVEIDPWADDAIRDASLDRARAEAHVIVDGAVARDRGGFRVEIALASVRTGVRRARGDAWHRDLGVAVAHALDDGLDEMGASRPAELGELTRERFGVGDREGLLALHDLRETFHTYASLDDAWARAERDGGRGGPLAYPLLERLARLADQPVPRDPGEGPLDPEQADAERLLARADELARARRAEPPPRDPRRTSDSLAEEATIRARAGDAEASRELSLAAVAIDPEDGPWEVLVEASYARAGFGSVGRAYATWQPQASDAYNVMAQDPRARTPELRARLLERAYLLSSAAPLYAANYARTLILSDRLEEARAVAASLHLGSVVQGFAADRIDAEIQMSEGRVAASYATLLDVLRRVPTVGSVERGDAVVVGLAADAAHLLGREDELAALVTARFVDHPVRIVKGAFAITALVQGCALARPELARPCVERLAELDASGHFRDGASPDAAPFLRGALLWVHGDVPGAASAFRALAGRIGFGQRPLVARVLEAAGDLDAADRLDDPATTRGLFAGVSPSDARAAIRAHRRGDPRARAMARRVLDAWAGADARLAPSRQLEAIAR
jgi:hypothetical protein